MPSRAPRNARDNGQGGGEDEDGGGQVVEQRVDFVSLENSWKTCFLVSPVIILATGGMMVADTKYADTYIRVFAILALISAAFTVLWAFLCRTIIIEAATVGKLIAARGALLGRTLLMSPLILQFLSAILWLISLAIAFWKSQGPQDVNIVGTLVGGFVLLVTIVSMVLVYRSL